MSWVFILRRMWRNRRDMVMLTVAISLITGFFALSPLYLRILGESALTYAVNTALPRDLLLSFLSPSPLDSTARSRIQEELGTTVSGIESRIRLSTIVCNENANVCRGDQYGRAYIPTAYERLAERFTLTDGTYPAEIGQVALTVEVARQTNLTVGDTIIFYPDTTDTVNLQVVGILTPIDPTDPFWITQQTIIQGSYIDVTDNIQRFDLGVIFSEAAYSAQIAPIGRVDTLYEWYVEINSGNFRAAELNDFIASVTNLEREFRLQDPNSQLVSGLTSLFQRFQSDLTSVEGTVILFAGGVLVLLFYQLMTTTALILERNTIEWSSITSRGGSTFQLCMMQAQTMTILALMAFVLGIPIAVGIVLLLGWFSPVGNSLESGLAVTTLPPLSFVMSGIASLIAIIVLTIPAIPAARSSLLRLKQSISRPSITPLWARYYLDFIFLGISIILLLRLYFTFGGTSIDALVNDPALLTRLITANSAQNTNLLSDPFNIAIPILVIMGIALLWLRIFPLLMRGLSALFSRSNGIVAPLAIWNIARDPGHYAQLVMMLIGALAIGTASLSLAATHDHAAWESALNSVGDEVALTFAAEAPTLNQPNIDEEQLARYSARNANGQEIILYGVSNERFTTLTGDPPASQPRAGVELPHDAHQITMDVYAEPLADQPVRTRFALEVINALGIPRSIIFTTEDETVTQRFIPYSADLPDDPHLPYTVTGIRFLSRADINNFEHILYIDNFAYVSQTGTIETLDDFERAAITDWSMQGRALSTRSQVASGEYSMRVNYTIAARGIQLIEPILTIRPQLDVTIPVILSSSFSRTQGARNQQSSYNIDDRANMRLNLSSGGQDLHFQVTGFLANYPAASTHFLIAPIDDLLIFLNAKMSPDAYYANNTLWLTLPDRQLSPVIREELEALPNLISLNEAWDTYNQLLRVPLPNAIIGVLFAGFGVSLLLGLLDFAFYLIVTATRRATTFAVLRALGLNGVRLWGMLTAEQIFFISPALIVGIFLGGILAQILMPFLILANNPTPQFPINQIGQLLAVLIFSFTVLLLWIVSNITRSQIGQNLRRGEE